MEKSKLEKKEPEITDADPSVIRRLAELGPGPRILSIYLDLGPDEYPTPKDRESEVVSLLDDASRRLEELEAQDKKALRRDVERLRTYFLEEPGWARGARSLAVFCSGQRDLFEIVRLPVPVPSRVVIETSPYLAPVVGAVPERRLCVVLVDRAAARIFCGSEAGLEEGLDIRDEVHGQHDQGGWSQARYQRSVEDDVDDHLRNVAARLLELHREGQIDRLIVGCTEELLPRFLDKLHAYLRERFAGRIEIDVQGSPADEALARAKELLLQDDEREERQIFERLRRELAVQGKAVAGLEPTLAAVNESRVETLLARQGLQAPGVFCPKCGWLGSAEGADGRRCPVDDAELEETGNVVEKALERTLLLSGTTRVPRFEPDLEQWGGIAALLRF